jgi:ATP-dependent Lon protease
MNSDQETRNMRGFPDPKDYEVPAITSDNLVLFPNSEVITSVKDKESLSAIRQALKEHKVIAHIPSSSWGVHGAIATLALLGASDQTSTGLNLKLKGMWRIRLEKFIKTSDYSKVKFEKVYEYVPTASDGIALVSKVHGEIDELVNMIPSIPSEVISLLKHINDPGALADMCANSPSFTQEDKVDLLGMLDQLQRLKKVSELLEEELKSLKKMDEVERISDCEKCIELADRAFESDPSKISEIAIAFLNHVASEHTGEIIELLAEKYGPIFLNRRMLK